MAKQSRRNRARAETVRTKPTRLSPYAKKRLERFHRVRKEPVRDELMLGTAPEQPATTIIRVTKIFPERKFLFGVTDKNETVYVSFAQLMEYPDEDKTRARTLECALKRSPRGWYANRVLALTTS